MELPVSTVHDPRILRDQFLSLYGHRSLIIGGRNGPMLVLYSSTALNPPAHSYSLDEALFSAWADQNLYLNGILMNERADLHIGDVLTTCFDDYCKEPSSPLEGCPYPKKPEPRITIQYEGQIRLLETEIAAIRKKMSYLDGGGGTNP